MANYLLSSYTSAIRKEGVWTPGTYGGFDASLCESACAVLRFKATTTTIGGFFFQDGSKYAVYKKQSGVWTLVSRSAFGSSNTWGQATLASGLDGGTETEYLIGFGPVNVYFSHLTADALTTATLPQRNTLGCFGDSTVQATQGTSGDATLSDIFAIGLLYDLAVYNRGIGGTTVRNVSGSDTTAGEARTSNITGISPSPANVFIRYGLNDVGQVKGAETSAQFQSSYTNMLTLLTAGLPSTKFFNFSIIATSSGGYPSYTPWNAAMQAAIAAVNTANGNSNCVFVDTTGWTEYTGASPSQTSDTVHPNAAGYAILYAREYPYFADPSKNLLLLGVG